MRAGNLRSSCYCDFIYNFGLCAEGVLFFFQACREFIVPPTQIILALAMSALRTSDRGSIESGSNIAIPTVQPDEEKSVTTQQEGDSDVEAEQDDQAALDEAWGKHGKVYMWIG
jgi:hypothetical protein